VPVYAGGTAAGNKAVQIFKAMAGQRGSAFLEPEWIALHPDDWRDIRLLTDTAGQFFGGGPFQGPYGSGTNYGASGQLTARSTHSGASRCTSHTNQSQQQQLVTHRSVLPPGDVRRSARSG
jgi:hypothetical protein